MKLLLIPKGRNFLICLPTLAPTPPPPHAVEFDARSVAGYQFLIENVPKSGQVVVNALHARWIMRGCVELPDSHRLRRSRRKSRIVSEVDAAVSQARATDTNSPTDSLEQGEPSSTATRVSNIPDE